MVIKQKKSTLLTGIVVTLSKTNAGTVLQGSPRFIPLTAILSLIITGTIMGWNTGSIDETTTPTDKNMGIHLI